MKISRFTDSQIMAILKQNEAGASVPENEQIYWLKVNIFSRFWNINYFLRLTLLVSNNKAFVQRSQLKVPRLSILA